MCSYVNWNKFVYVYSYFNNHNFTLTLKFSLFGEVFECNEFFVEQTNSFHID
jgi:hypothetical protein